MPADDDASHDSDASSSTSSSIVNSKGDNAGDDLERAAAALDALVPGAVNLRPVPPLSTTSGSHRLKPGALFRSGMTHEISHEALSALVKDRGVRTVLDLRTTSERERHGVARFSDLGVAHHHAEMDDPLDRDPAGRREKLAAYRAGTWEWSESYGRVAASSGPSLAHAIAVIAGEVPGSHLAVLVHCAAGRDRTGITIGLVLHALGVDPDRIADDYARSGPHLVAQATRFFRPAPNPEAGLTLEDIGRILATDRADLLRFFARLESHFGSVDAYLDSIGVDEAMRNRLRERLLEPR